MTYDEAVRYLLALGGELAAPRQPALGAAGARVAKFDLRNITALATHLGSPHRAVRCAHIAGTNGKGSTAAMLESILRQAGLKTGLYTSPHLERINERIAVNGEAIGDADFAATFSRVQQAIEELLASGELAAHPTFFECVTAMAFARFAGLSGGVASGAKAPQKAGAISAGLTLRPPAADAGQEPRPTKPHSNESCNAESAVDFAVYEVGMGGRLDSTNIVQPEVCVITQIDFDHENFLGHSIEEIAGEKAGILKPGVPVVCAAGRPEARAVIARRAAELGAPVIDLDEHSEGQDELRPMMTSADAVHLQPTLRGRFQLRNALAATAAALELRKRGFHISHDAIAVGIAQTRWPGRLEQVGHAPDVYLDGTHNPAGARELLAFWDSELSGRRIFLVYGAVRDKAVEEITGLLFPRAARVICTQPRTVRAISAQKLFEIAGHDADHVEVISKAGAALEHALKLAAPEDVVFATGSLYLVGDLRRWWRERHAARKE